MSIIDDIGTIVGARYIETGPDFGRFGRDWSGALRWTPLAVVRPASTGEVAAILAATYGAGVPVTPVGGNTGVSGGSLAEAALMLSLDRMNRIDAVNAGARTLRVEAGAIVANIQTAAEDRGLIFPLTFGAQGSAQIGGALSTNAGGANVLRYGNARALCLGIEAVMPDGRVMDLMSELHKDNSGYDLRDLIIGAEGTLGVITGAVLRLFAQPRASATVMIACHTLENALATLNALQAATGNSVEAFEYMPDVFVARHMARMAGARQPFDATYPVNILAQVSALAERDAAPDDAGRIPLHEHLAGALADLMRCDMIADAVIAKSDAQAAAMWARRDAAAELALCDPPFYSADVALPLDRVSEFLETAHARVASVDPKAVPLWVAHLGDGNVHYTVRMSRDDRGLETAIVEAIEDVVAHLRGSFSAEHGVGTFKRGSMARRKDPVALEVMAAIKAAIDPKGLMNPGKVLPGS